MATEHEPYALASQVGGHAGVLAFEGGSLIIKPALNLELEFYQLLQQSPDLAPLLPFTPRFYGTLELQGKVDESKPAVEGMINVTPTDAPQKESLVLENLSHRFVKPNIMDIKLGTILYDESASPAKVERMIKTARETTSLETGVRLTGFQVHDNASGLPVNTPKSYGKSIKPSDLPEGTRRFFSAADALTTEGGKGTNGLRVATLLPIIQAIRKRVQEIRDVFANLELRMIGGSLLFVYEADWATAEEGLERIDVEEEEDDEESDEEEQEQEEENKKLGAPYVVKVIDFAHTRLVPGQGPDEGVLLGMDTVLRLLDGRIAELTTN